MLQMATDDSEGGVISGRFGLSGEKARLREIMKRLKEIEENRKQGKREKINNLIWGIKI